MLDAPAASTTPPNGQTMNPNATPWTRARVALLGHTALGVVRLRYTDGGGIELSDGRRYGPGAIFSIEPLPPEMVPTEAEIQRLQTAFGEDTVIEQDTRGRWSILLSDGTEWAALTILEAVASAIQGIRFTDRMDHLREGAASVVPADPRAALLLEALTKLEPSEKSAVLRRSPTYGPTMPGDWSLSINYQPDCVKGTLDDIARYVLNMGKPAEVEPEPVADGRLVVTPVVVETEGDDETPF